jgi:hypothetical protein
VRFPVEPSAEPGQRFCRLLPYAEVADGNARVLAKALNESEGYAASDLSKGTTSKFVTLQAPATKVFIFH